MQDYLWYERQQKVFEKSVCEPKIGPIMPIFQNLQAISIELNIAIEIHFLKCVNGDFVVPTILQAVGFLVEGQVVFNWTTGQFDLLIFSGGIFG
jgi:hypothetical protein